MNPGQIIMSIWADFDKTLTNIDKIELMIDKTNDLCFSSSEDSDQPEYLPSLTRVFNVRMKKAQVFSYPFCS